MKNGNNNDTVSDKEIKPLGKKRGNNLVCRRDEDMNKRLDWIISKNSLLQNDSDATRFSIISTSDSLGYVAEEDGKGQA